jgi:lipopolysaccharide export system protein LptC
MVGAIAPAKGLAVLQPIILTFLVLCFIIWCFVQNSPKEPWKELRVTNRDLSYQQRRMVGERLERVWIKC